MQLAWRGGARFWQAAYGLFDQLLRLGHIFGPPDEAERDIVHALLHAEDQISAVLLGESGRADRDTGQVDPLVLGKRAAMDDLGNDILLDHPRHAQLDGAIREQDGIAAFDILWQVGIGSRDNLTCPYNGTRRQDKTMSISQKYRPAALQRAGTRSSAPASPAGWRPGDSAARATARTRAMVAACWSCVPWEKLIRATSIPARISASTRSSVEVAGPSVQTILVWRIDNAAALTDAISPFFRIPRPEAAATPGSGPTPPSPGVPGLRGSHRCR